MRIPSTARRTRKGPPGPSSQGLGAVRGHTWILPARASAPLTSVSPEGQLCPSREAQCQPLREGGGGQVTPSCVESRLQGSRGRVISFRGSVSQSACSSWGAPLPVPRKEDRSAGGGPQPRGPSWPFTLTLLFCSRRQRGTSTYSTSDLPSSKTRRGLGDPRSPMRLRVPPDP